MSRANPSADIKGAEAQTPQSDKEGPSLVPTGDYITNTQNEVQRVMGLMQGVIPEDEKHMALEQEQQIRDETRGSERPPAEIQIPEGKTIEELLGGAPEGEPQPTMEGAAPTGDDSQFVDIGGTRVPLSTVNDWKDSWENSAGMLKNHQDQEAKLQQDRVMWGESLKQLRDDPIQGLQAIGLQPQQLVQKLQESGLLANQPANQNPVTPQQGDFQVDEDTPPVVRQLIEQNQRLSAQIQASSNRFDELAGRIDKQSRSNQEQEILDWHNNRVSTSKGYLQNIVDQSSNLDGSTKALLMKATMADVEQGIDSAPLDEPGLKEWAKSRLKDSLGVASPEDMAQAISNPSRSKIPVRSGETPRAPAGQLWDQVNHNDDDDRKRGALAWMDHYARDL